MIPAALRHASTFNQSEILVSTAYHCHGKQKHDRATANRIRRETKKVALDAYHCDVCDHWHVGVPRSGRKSIKRNRMREFGAAE